ncbi:MAG: peptidyl-prolyl cis-trans isomerase [Candidatus Latescibacteria bacterium]|nr:peptidyl-prolyl cis-trans isomerase [Candidatus Latescibacterota bacterium]
MNKQHTKKNSKFGLVVLIIPLLFTIIGCPKQEPVLAKVGNANLTKKELSLQLPPGVRLTRDNINSLIDKWINTELIYQEAKRRKIDRDETLQVQLNQLIKELIVNKLLEQEMDKITVTRQEVFDYFTKHKEEFLYEVKISRIVLLDESLAYRVHSQLVAGADFNNLAQNFSQDRVLEKGAESKYFARGVGDPRAGGDPNLEEAIFALSKNQISDVIKTQEGFQIVKLIDRQKVKKDIPLAEVEEYINSIISYRKSREMLDSMIQNLKANTQISQTPEAYFQ